MQKLIKDGNNYHLVDDGEIQEGDYVIDNTKSVLCLIDFDGDFAGIKDDPGSVRISSCRKIIRSTDQNLVAAGIPQLTHLTVNEAFSSNLKALLDEKYPLSVSPPNGIANWHFVLAQRSAFAAGYRAHKELTEELRFTKEGMIEAYKEGFADADIGSNLYEFEETLLPQTKWAVEVDEVGNITLI
jgi:hypothetical protein